MSGAGTGGILLVQRYELAAELCRGLRVLDLSDAPGAARAPLEASASELTVGPAAGEFDAVVALTGVGQELVAELERHAAAGTRVLAAFERAAGRPESPRVTPGAEDAARALAARLPAAQVMPQFIAEGSLIGAPDGSGTPEFELRDRDAREEDAAALIVASGFDSELVSRARASLRLTVSPVLLSYLRSLETAHAELLRANRQLMRERVGRDGSAAASLLNAQRELETMRGIARSHEDQVRRVEAWYDAPRYHLVDRVRETLTKIPGVPGMIRFLWSLISTRAESPSLDAAANPEPDDEGQETADVTRAREGLSADEEESEPTEVTHRLEE